jgi:hypothetical protein
VLKILQVVGPELYQSPALIQSFTGLRGLIVRAPFSVWPPELELQANLLQVFVTLSQRKENFLSKADWTHKPYKSRVKTRREMLHDIAFKIPALLDRTDTFIAALSTESDSQLLTSSSSENDYLAELVTAEEVLDQLTQVRIELESWFQDLRDAHAPIPLYWETDEVFDSSYVLLDPHCQPVHANPGHRLRFRDGNKAGSLMTFWAIKLELLSAMIDIQETVSTLMTTTPGSAVRAISICQALKANRAAADKVTELMTQSLPYLECCLEGVFCSRLPMRHANKYNAAKKARSSTTTFS